jgi:mRNA-degrading endonuclease RelE of RelBE toxin-antitoxin system
MDFYEHGFKKLKLTDMEQQDIEVAIMVNPEGPPRVEGTGGLRKIRIAFDRLHKGKSNGFRVGYCYFANHGIVLLLTIYDHNVKDNLSMSDKAQIKTLIEEIEMYLKQRSREN